MFSKNVLLCLGAILAFCYSASAYLGEEPLTTLAEALQNASSRETIQFSSNMREIGFRVNTHQGPKVITFPPFATLKDISDKLASAGNLGSKCNFTSTSRAPIPEKLFGYQVFPTKTSSDTHDDMTILRCERSHEDISQYPNVRTEDFLVRPAIYDSDYTPEEDKDEQKALAWTIFNRDCSLPHAPANCEELLKKRRALSSTPADINDELPLFYREAYDYLWVTSNGLARWAYEWATWHKGPVHPFLDYTSQPSIAQGGHTGVYGINNGTTLSTEQSVSLAQAGTTALVKILQAQSLPENEREAVIQDILNTYAPNSAKDIRFTMTGDWGSGTYESELVTKLMSTETTPHWTFHLGDIYFTGNPDEIRHNILGVVPEGAQQAVKWRHGSLGSFAFEGNHELYSMGNGYFKDWLPTLGVKNPQTGKPSGQKASYAAFENEFWRVIGIDTGYGTFDPVHETHHNPQPDQVVDWMRNVLKLGNSKEYKDNRGIIIIGHHQYHSAFERQFTATPEQLSEFIGVDQPILWFWGHEHKLSIYAKGQVQDVPLTVFGRCIGIGGYPTSHVPIPPNARSNGLYAYDDRTWQVRTGEIGTYSQGFNGYAALKLHGHKVSVEYRTLKLQSSASQTELDPNATEVVMTESFAINPLSRQIEQTDFKILNDGVVIIDNIEMPELDDINDGLSAYYLNKPHHKIERTNSDQAHDRAHLRSDALERYHSEL